MNCRFCDRPLHHVFADLGTAPPSNAFLSPGQLLDAETWLPLKALVCDRCFLVQLDEVRHTAELFTDDYVYFSSVSRSWLDHAKRYVDSVVKRLSLDTASLVVEVASNDGYLLQYVREKGIPCLGVEPTAGTAEAAEKKGIPVVREFFGQKLASRLAESDRKADLLLGNNVLAHVPGINDFVAGLKILLKPNGTITLEFPHLVRLVEDVQFDTIYHEHYFYFSLTTVVGILRRHGLKIYDVEQLSTHGGSLRVYASHSERTEVSVASKVTEILEDEKRRGIALSDFYRGFDERIRKTKFAFLDFLLDCRKKGLRVAGYGAAAKGNTLLNFCGVRSDLIEFACDRAPSKQGRFLPGSRIPVVAEEMLKERKPDVIVLFPWNLKEELVVQLDYVRQWNARFVTAIPEPTVF